MAFITFCPICDASLKVHDTMEGERVRCKKCGVQYPSFMRTCPNCNEPR